MSAATGGGFGGKPRPVVVVQGDLYLGGPNVVVALIESATDRPRRTRPRIIPDQENNLRVESDVAVDLLVTVPRRKFGAPIGRISSDDLQRVDSALMVMLGLAG